MSQIVICVEKIGKQYHIGTKENGQRPFASCWSIPLVGMTRAFKRAYFESTSRLA
jgi:hypothetical protein